MRPRSTAVAAAAADITVNIDTGASVTLKDTDGDGAYEIGNADQLYAFAAAVNADNEAINGFVKLEDGPRMGGGASANAFDDLV